MNIHEYQAKELLCGLRVAHSAAELAASVAKVLSS
jgi:succinyl-CoA synthetase beta subunit